MTIRRIVLFALLAGLLPAPSASAASLHVIPFPGTPDAAPASEIIFSSLRPADFAGSPTVTGSSSGPHTGRLISLPDDAGTAFIPAQPFTPGERVTVLAGLTSPRAARASGLSSGQILSFSFHVALSPPGDSVIAPRTGRARPAPTGPFRSAPGLDPPPVARSSRPAPGSQSIFLSPYVWGHSSYYQTGVMILDARGRTVWFRPVVGGNLVPYNLEVQHYHGRPVLTWWQGDRWHNTSTNGQDVILNSSYRPVAVLHAAYGYSSDLHEFQLTPRGTAFIDAYVPVEANLSSVGGPAKGTLSDCVIQELDVRTGAILWEWHAWGHVPLRDSELVPSATGRYDAFHLNSIQQLPGHRLLVSLRNTSALYEIDEGTGRVIWTLGGRHSNFRMGPRTGFEWQHDAHLYRHGLLTLFDDADSPQEEPQSSAKELRVDFKRHTVRLIRRFVHSPPLLAGAEGSAQLLSNGDMFVGWGDLPTFSQYSPDGHQIFDASFPLGVKSYRAYRFAWTGHPLTQPSLALTRPSQGVTWAYMSWNGATEVARWRVLGGKTSGALKPLKTKPWSGFETSIALPGAPRYLAVQALDTRGRVLGESQAMPRPGR